MTNKNQIQAQTTSSTDEFVYNLQFQRTAPIWAIFFTKMGFFGTLVIGYVFLSKDGAGIFFTLMSALFLYWRYTELNITYWELSSMWLPKLFIDFLTTNHSGRTRDESIFF